MTTVSTLYNTYIATGYSVYTQPNSNTGTVNGRCLNRNKKLGYQSMARRHCYEHVQRIADAL
jgi:hypothetical protein